MEAMIYKMVELKGVGLAAPQVGHNLRIIIVQMEDGEIQEMINPVITEFSDDLVTMEEGCLSIPDHYIDIARPSTIKVKFQDANGKYKRWVLDGIEARIVQHEVDHLDGKMMTRYEKGA
jgi:peptide deformylase